MIVLPTLRKMLEASLAGTASEAQTIALFTPPGALIAWASRAQSSPSDPLRAFSRDDVRMVVGLAVDYWTQECGPVSEERTLMLECENLGRLVVVPVYADNQTDEDEWPVMLLAVHGPADADFDQLAAVANGPAEDLAGPLASYPRDILNNESPIAH
ncbi:hypothetical protein BKA62DRAFT_669425 [Auriculariales sp. MPI-PUGE-AT-0066]|nr:hypothetical protein BKA62DRAFT_669425 [Auriculariales sp. MPI-PUGE-AT-0066]